MWGLDDLSDVLVIWKTSQCRAAGCRGPRSERDDITSRLDGMEQCCVSGTNN